MSNGITTSKSEIKSDGADATARILKSDGWDNFLGGMAKANKLTKISFGGGVLLSRQDCTSMYRYGGMARRLIDMPAEDMTREWITIDGDEDGLALQKMEEINAKSKFRDALKWSRLFGGSLMVIIADDGNPDLSAQLNEANIRDIVDLRVYDRHQISWFEDDIDDDLLSTNFGLPRVYTITPYTSSRQTTFRVHYSRVIRFDGADLPEHEKQLNNGWGDTVYHSIYEELRNLGVVNNSTAGIVQDFIQTIVQIENLAELIAADQEALVKKRMELIDLGRSIFKTILLDKEENYEKKASSVAGLADLVDRAMIMLSASSGYPVTKLFGRSAAGMNSTGDNDLRNYYDETKSKQSDILGPALERFIKLIMLCKDGPFKGKEPPDWSIIFNPLWQMSDKENADIRKTVAETDKIYIEQNVLDPTEVAVARFGGARYSMDMTLDTKFRETDLSLPEPEPEVPPINSNQPPEPTDKK